MSNSTANDLRSALNDAGLLRAGDGLVALVRRLAFWTAVALPFLYLPLLVMDPSSPVPTDTAFLVLLLCNAVALFVGHPHYRD